jgi:hypothetical protein
VDPELKHDFGLLFTPSGVATEMRVTPARKAAKTYASGEAPGGDASVVTGAVPN